MAPVAPAISSRGVVGWDIGGVNLKVARLECPDERSVGSHLAAPAGLTTASRWCEIQHEADRLVHELQALARNVGAVEGDVHVVTMTAELSQMFRCKRDGVTFVIDAVVEAFPTSTVSVYTTEGRFLSPSDACAAPMSVAAANWSATARFVSSLVQTAMLVDIGTTTTDIIPLVDGEVCARGWTDPDRLRFGELVYLGVVRTPVEAVTSTVPLRNADCGVSAEGFALTGDVYVWLGLLPESAYTQPPDGRDVSRVSVGERLARVVCADRELLDDSAIDDITHSVALCQRNRIATAIARVAARHPEIDTVVVTGVGDFLAAAAATDLGLRVRHLSRDLGLDAARIAPAVAVAVLRAAAGIA